MKFAALVVIFVAGLLIPSTLFAGKDCKNYTAMPPGQGVAQQPAQGHFKRCSFILPTTVTIPTVTLPTTTKPPLTVPTVTVPLPTTTVVIPPAITVPPPATTLEIPPTTTKEEGTTHATTSTTTVPKNPPTEAESEGGGTGDIAMSAVFSVLGLCAGFLCAAVWKLTHWWH